MAAHFAEYGVNKFVMEELQLVECVADYRLQDSLKVDPMK